MKNLRKINLITKNIDVLETGELLSIYLYIKNRLNERIKTGHINTHQLKEIANTPIINDVMRKEILTW